MAPCCMAGVNSSPDLRAHFLYERFILLNEYGLSKHLNLQVMRKLCFAKKFNMHYKNNDWCSYSRLAIGQKIVFLFLLLFLSSFFLFKLPLLDGIVKTAVGIKCVLPNNYVVWEATRPIANCDICSNVSNVLVLHNITRGDFKQYAYSYRPIVIKGAALHWSALKTFSYHYFKDIFQRTEGAFESVEEECQFLNFKSDFKSLSDVFDMPSNRVRYQPGTKPWYIGWSNCHREVLKEMRRHYQKPHFLPRDAEHSHVDFIFMGYDEGAFMHLDYISRLMWQAQLRGHKEWRLHPPPECEHSCSSLAFHLNPGDILLLDTRQWYHSTFVQLGEFSLTVSSEYG